LGGGAIATSHGEHVSASL